MTAFWRQWDAADLSSWQGIEEEDDTTGKDDDAIHIQHKEQEDPFTGSMDDYGLNWGMF